MILRDKANEKNVIANVTLIYFGLLLPFPQITDSVFFYEHFSGKNTLKHADKTAFPRGNLISMQKRYFCSIVIEKELRLV